MTRTSSQPWIWAYGGGLVNPLKKEILIASKNSINGMTAYKRLFDSSCAFKNEDFANDYNNAQTAFKNGDVAMIENGPWATADVLSGKAFADKSNLGVAPLPKGPGGQGSPVGGHSFVIAKKSKKVAAAYKFDPVPDEGVEPGELRLEEQPAADAAVGVPERRGEEAIRSSRPSCSRCSSRAPARCSRRAAPIYTDFTPNVQKVLLGQSTPTQGMNAVAAAWKTKLFRTYTIKKN